MMDRIRAALMPQGNRPNMIVQQNTSPLLQQALMQGAYANDPIETPIEGIGRLAQLSAAKNIERSRKEQEKARYGKIAEALGGDDPIAALLQSGDPDLMKMGIQQKMATPKDTRTEAQKNYEYSQENKGFNDWQLEQRRASSDKIMLAPDENAYDKKLGGKYAERFDSLQTEAGSAQRALNSFDAMESLMADDQFYSGAAPDAVLTLKRIARSLGINEEGVDSMEAFNSLSKAAALDAMGGSLGAGFSNADRDFVIDQVPNLGNTKEGNTALMGIQRKINRRKIEIAQLARDYAKQNNGRIDMGFDEYVAQWAEQNPLFDRTEGGDKNNDGVVDWQDFFGETI